MVKTKEFKKEIFPINFVSLFPKTCEVCGSDIEVTETLTHMQCSNRKCPTKAEHRLYSLLKDIGVDIDIEDCVAFLKRFKTNNPYSIFLYNPKVDGALNNRYTLQQSNELHKKLNQRRGMLLHEYVRIGNFPNLSGSAEKLFKNYKNINDFYSDLEKKGVQFVQNLLMKDVDMHLQGDEVVIKAVIVYAALITYKKEIIEGLKGVVLLEPQVTQAIFFANEPIGYNSKKEYLLYLNNLYKKKKVYFYETLNKPVEDAIVYWEKPITNRETSIIKEIKEKNDMIKIVNKDTLTMYADTIIKRGNM